jgi:hypothetical protein
MRAAEKASSAAAEGEQLRADEDPHHRMAGQAGEGIAAAPPASACDMPIHVRQRFDQALGVRTMAKPFWPNR